MRDRPLSVCLLVREREREYGALSIRLKTAENLKFCVHSRAGGFVEKSAQCVERVGGKVRSELGAKFEEVPIVILMCRGCSALSFERNLINTLGFCEELDNFLRKIIRL